MKISLTLLVTILVLTQLSLELHIGAVHDIEHTFCWRDSYGRGVGTIPGECGTKEKIMLLCYEPCPSGYTRSGLDCLQNCPTGFRDDGLFCRDAEYGRGAGYAWWFSDGFTFSGMFKRCEAEHGKGNCEKYLAMVYPKCKPGYAPFGCCICRPVVPGCHTLGMNGGLDLSCAKKYVIGSPSVADCAAGSEYDAGLCYPKCKSGYTGVGPLCWAEVPTGWVSCGMAIAKDEKTCKDTTVSQMTSVGTLAMTIFTLGTSTAANSAKTAAVGASQISKLGKKLEELKAAVRASANIQKVVDQAKKFKEQKIAGQNVKDVYDKTIGVVSAVEQLNKIEADNYTDADIVRVSAKIAALADPTGVASVVESYSHPLCSEIIKK